MKEVPLIKDCVKYLKEELHCLGIYAVYTSDTEVSMKFAERKIGSLRIACIPSDFRYRWNITCGDFIKVTTKYKSHWYEIEEAHHFVERIKKYAATIARNAKADTELGGFLDSAPDIEEPPKQELLPLDAYDNIQPTEET